MAGERYHYDGDFSVPEQDGDLSVEDLVETNSRLYRVKYLWLTEELEKKSNRLNYNLRGPNGTPMAGCPLVEQGPSEDLGGGICRFERTYAEIPKARLVPEAFNFPYQGINGGKLFEVALPTRSTLLYTYFFYAAPNFILTDSPGRFVEIEGAGILHTGGYNNLGEPESVERWRGNIWVKKSRTITPPTFDAPP